MLFSKVTWYICLLIWRWHISKPKSVCFLGLILIKWAVLAREGGAHKGVQSPTLLAASVIYPLLRSMGYRHCWCCTALGTWSLHLGAGPVTTSSNIFLLKINQLFPKLHTTNSITAGMMDNFTLHRQLNILSQGKSLCHLFFYNSRCFCDLYRPQCYYCSWEKLEENSAALSLFECAILRTVSGICLLWPFIRTQV